MAHNTSGAIFQAIDNEKMVILTQPLSSSEPLDVFFTKLENTLVDSLAAQIPAAGIIAASTSTESTISAIADNFLIEEISEDDRETFALETTSDVSDISFALLTKYESQILADPDTTEYDIGTSDISITKSIGLGNLLSLYNSNVKLEYSYNSDAIQSTSSAGGSALPINLNGDFLVEEEGNGVGPWTASFDSSNSNVNYNKAINSEYNNPDYERPMSVETYSVFNNANALGLDLSSSIQHYYTVDTNGKPILNNISNSGASSSTGAVSSSYRLYDNGVVVTKDTTKFNNISQSNLGSYRFQQFPSVPLVTITQDTTNNFSTSQEDIAKFPLFNANAGADLPTNTLSLDQFNTLFGNNESILPAYKYTVSITEDTSSGYSLSQTELIETDNGEAPIFSLDNSKLKDNETYIKHYVNGEHTLSFADATLAIQKVGAASQSNVFTLSEEREYIEQSNYHDGQIKINTNTPATRHMTINGDLAVSPSVYYNGEGTSSSKSGISQDLKENRYAAFLDQLVMQNSSNINDYFMNHNNVAFDLYKDGIVNANFNTSDFEFSATGKTTGVDAEVIRITPSKQLASVNGFSKQSDLSSVNGIYAFATLSNLKTTLISNDNVFDKAQMLFNLKKLAGSKIKTISTEAGWGLVTSDVNDNMNSSSASAFSSDSTHFPSLELTRSLISGSSAGIDFTISVLTDDSGDATQVEQLRDEVKIEYWVTGTTNNKQALIIPQELLSKTPVGTDAAPVFGSAIQISSSDLTNKMSGKTIDVYPVTATKNYTYSFELPLRGFTGLTMTTPTITSTTTYHIIKDRTTNEQLPSSFHQYVKVGFYKNISESFATVSSVSGTFDNTDLCDMLVKVVSTDTDENEIPTVADRVLTDTVSVSMYYGIDLKTNLKSDDKDGVSSVNGDITLRCECDYSNQVNAESVVTLNDNAGYVIRLTNNFDSVFTCDYWSSTLANINSSTSIASDNTTTDYTNDDKTLTVQNGYSSINGWISTSHKVVLSHADNKATTILSIQKVDGTELYQIKTKNFTYLNTQAFISNVSKDIHRVDSWIGSTAETNTFIEKFIQADYTGNVFEIYTGVYLNKNSSFFIGQYYKFTLKQDLIAVNLIGDAVSDSNMFSIGANSASITNHDITNDGLSFQYNDGNGHVSCVLSIDRYRGFHGPEPNNTALVQVYTIQRDTMMATLTIQKDSDDTSLPASITQSWNVYSGSTYIVDGLSGSIGNIGLEITFSLSMLSPSDTRSFTIYTRGDAISFSIVNPDAEEESYRSAPVSRNLKHFELDTFLGTNFNNTENSLSINSRRLKLKSDNTSNTFTDTTASWSVELISGQIKIYQKSNYLGNPVTIDTNDAYAEPDSTKWTNITPIWRDSKSNYYDFTSNNGITVNGWTFKRDSSTNSLPSVSFYVMAPPYYKFSMIQSVSKDLPCLDSTTGLRSIYLPVVTSNVYNPFTATKTYTYSHETTTVTVSNDQDVANDVTFSNSDTHTLSSFTTSSSKYHFVVEAPKLSMSLLRGLKSEVSTSIILTLFDNMPVNRLMYCDKNTSPYVLFMDTLINSGSGIRMKIFQPENAVNPSPTATSEEIFSTQRTEYNLTINIDNFFIYPDSSIMEEGPTNNTFSLDLPNSNGNKVYMYTRESSNDENGNHVITVYRYDAINSVDLNTDNLNVNPEGIAQQVVSVTYTSREKKQLTIPMSAFKTFLSSSTTDLKTAFETFVKQYATTNNIISDFNDQEWVSDNSWQIEDGKYNTVYFSLVCPSSVNSATIPAKFFVVNIANCPCRGVYVTKAPLLTSFDKFGRKNFQVTGWGTAITTSLSTSNVILNRSYNNPVSNTFTNINNGSVTGHKLNPQGLA